MGSGRVGVGVWGGGGLFSLPEMPTYVCANYFCIYSAAGSGPSLVHSSLARGLARAALFAPILMSLMRLFADAGASLPCLSAAVGAGDRAAGGLHQRRSLCEEEDAAVALGVLFIPSVDSVPGPPTPRPG